jgi:ribulose-phosphate 3-epimerase
MRVAVSLTSADPLRLSEAAARAIAAGADALHVDVGDGRFTPWLGGSVELVGALARLDRAPVEVHLMVEDPEVFIAPIAAAGAASVLVHVERSPYPWRLRAVAHRLGMRFGIAANPATPLALVEPLVGCADFVTLLSTEPDAAGERMLPGIGARVWAVRAMYGDAVSVEVDGGVNADNVGELAARGASGLVVGRAVLDASDPGAVVARLRTALEGALT